MSELEPHSIESFKAVPVQEGNSDGASKVLGTIADVYFKPKPWESETAYEAMGVRYFQKFLKLAPFYRLGGKSINMTRALGYFNETVHAASFAFIIDQQVGLAKNGNWEELGLSTGINVLLNLYPIMSQRYNRIRMNKVMDRKKNRNEQQQYQEPEV